MNAIILYQSKYGATAKYARWLSEMLQCDIIETQKTRINALEKYDTVVLGGGIYAGGILGISFLKKNYEKLKAKKIAVFAVGASPYDEKAMTALKERFFKNELAAIPLFYCRGAWNEDAMSFKDKALCGMLKKVVSKKNPAEYEPWETALMAAIGTNCDWTDKGNLTPIAEYLNE